MSGWRRKYSVGGQEKAQAKGQTSRLVGRGTQRDNFSRAFNEATDLLPWDGARQAKLIKPWVSGKKTKANTFGLKWNSKSAALFDLSGRAKTPQGEQMITVLGARFGSPSRVMWKSYERADDQLQANMRKLIEEIMASVNKNMKVI
jgi:hypothetical protein